MSTQRKMRAEVRAESNDPINYTCGVCHQVHKFDKDKPFICDDFPEMTVPEEEEK